MSTSLLIPEEHDLMCENDLGAQTRAIRYAQKQGVDLSEALAEFQLSYDDLKYQFSRPQKRVRQNGFSLDSVASKRRNVPVVSFFSGGGGLDLGFETAGFDVVAAVEINPLFCQTLRLNHPSCVVIGPPHHGGDLSRPEEVEAQLGRMINRPFEGVFVGGPPCQPFSIAANQRFSKDGDKFKRLGFANVSQGNLLFDYIRLIERFLPKVFLIENVPGLIDIDGGEQVDRAVQKLNSAGYDVTPPRVIDAAQFGVPQHRKRAFIVGTRTGSSFSFPSARSALTPCGPALMKSVRKATNHVTRLHTVESIERYAKLWYGERDHLGRVDRLDPSRPSKTVIAGGVSGGGRSHLHPEIPRTLSVRECARLQTFPDTYNFVGPSARQFTQVGNAVPPLLAAQLAQRIAVAMGLKIE